MIKKQHVLGIGLVIGLSLPFVSFLGEAKANNEAQLIAQAESEEPVDSCVALQEISTGETEIRKRIENRVITQGNWNTDFLVPSDQNFGYFTAVLTPENNGTYQVTPNLRIANGATESVFTIRTNLVAGETYSFPFQSPTGRQPAVINMRVGGVNGHVYTLSVIACQ
jgi:hypothetical protein